LGFVPLIEVRSAPRTTRNYHEDANEQNDFCPSVHASPPTP
jgi:hypothetical protein